MTNIDFQTEDNINFYDLLKCDNLQENIIINGVAEPIDENNLCMITNLPLTLNSVILPKCKHKFNYLPLLKELLRQKNINSSEINKNHHYFNYYNSNNSVPNGFTKCPYCRTLNQGCLPYIEELYNHKYNDVNYPPYKAFNQYFCKHLMVTGKRKGQECGKLAYEVDKDVFTCKVHKPKPKSIKKSTKLIKSINISVENVIISTDNNNQTENNNNTCKIILKSGNRSGLECGSKLSKDSSMCLRHTNLSNKNKISINTSNYENNNNIN